MFRSQIENSLLKEEYFIKKKHNLTNSSYKTLLNKLLLCRVVENQISELLIEGLIKTPCHLSLGQEAIAAGIGMLYSKNDSIFSTHRCHAHYLAFDNDIEKFFYELFGFRQGASNGMGGSMHLFSKSPVNFHSLPIVGGTIPISLGSALFYKSNKKKNISYCFFGDGASEEGVFHESLNFAANLDLPIIFVCENNLYSSHLDIKLRQPSDKISRFANAHNIMNNFIFGNDILEVHRSYQQAIQHVKTKNKPFFLEFLTYRLVGHVGPDKNIDVGVRRKKKDLSFWNKNDPVKIYRDYLLNNKILTSKYFDDQLYLITNKIKKIVDKVKKNGEKPSKKFLEKFKRYD